MSYATLVYVDPIATPGAIGAAIRAGWRSWRALVRESTGWLVLIGLFAALQLADIVTTNIGLAVPGNWEANPLMAFSQAHLGALWWLPKAAGVLFVCLAARLLRRRWIIMFGVCFCAVVVSGNLLVR